MIWVCGAVFGFCSTFGLLFRGGYVSFIFVPLQKIWGTLDSGIAVRPCTATQMWIGWALGFRVHAPLWVFGNKLFVWSRGGGGGEGVGLGQGLTQGRGLQACTPVPARNWSQTLAVRLQGRADWEPPRTAP